MSASVKLVLVHYGQHSVSSSFIYISLFSEYFNTAMCSNRQVDRKCAKDYRDCIGFEFLLYYTIIKPDEIEQNFSQEIDAFEGNHPGYEFSYPKCAREVESDSQTAKEGGQTSAEEKSETKQIPQNINDNVKEASGKVKVDSEAMYSGKEAEKEVRPLFHLQGPPPAALKSLQLENQDGETLYKCDMATYLDMLFEARKCAVMNNEQVRKDFQSLNGVSVSKSDLGRFLCEEAKEEVIY